MIYSMQYTRMCTSMNVITPQIYWNTDVQTKDDIELHIIHKYTRKFTCKKVIVDIESCMALELDSENDVFGKCAKGRNSNLSCSSPSLKEDITTSADSS